MLRIRSSLEVILNEKIKEKFIIVLQWEEEKFIYTYHFGLPYSLIFGLL